MAAGSCEERVGSCTKTSNSWFQGSFHRYMKGGLWLQGSCAQPKVTILHLGGAFSSSEELKDIIMYIPSGGNHTYPEASPFFLDCSSFVLHSFTFLVSNCCLNLPFSTQRRSRRPKPFFLRTTTKKETGNIERICILLGFIIISKLKTSIVLTL